jgi:glycosyltransferase involved in cell wall biosynthesis
MDTPNYDSLCWFVDCVLPLVEAALGHETRLTVAGYVAPDVRLARFADHPRVTLRGPVAHLAPLYDRHRVVVAPTRFAAGTPYKVYEAASFGVPVVATTLLRDQLGWTDGAELLVAGADDAAGFAERTVALYWSVGLWNELRAAAMERLRRDNGRESYVRVLNDLLPCHDRPSRPIRLESAA